MISAMNSSILNYFSMPNPLDSPAKGAKKAGKRTTSKKSRRKDTSLTS